MVLVVDDSADQRESLMAFLELAGFRALGACDGAEALGVLQRGVRPCLILLDLMMPVMDGRRFREEQLKDAEFAAIPTVVVSAIHSQQRLDGVVAALPKPVPIDELLRLVTTHCSGVASEP